MNELRIMIEDLIKTESGELNLLGKALKIVLMFIVIKLILKYISSFINRTIKNNKLKQVYSEGRASTLGNIINSTAKYFLYFIWIMVSIDMFGVNTSSILATAGIGGLAIGFGAQSLVKDVITGFFIILEDQYSVGDYVKIGNFSGVVEDINLRVTKLRDFSGDIHIIPNNTIQVVSNSNRGNMRALVKTTISYEEDVEKVLKILDRVCNEIKASNENILDGPNVLGISDLAQSYIVIDIIAKTKPMEQWAVERQIRRAIKDAFNRENIVIPYPKYKLIGGGEV